MIQTAPTTPIKAVVFDAYGTLFDVYSIGALAEQLYPGHGAAISTMWRDKQIEYTRLITMSDPHNPAGSKHYLPFWDVTRCALDYTLDRLGLGRSAQSIDSLMNQYAKLTPFPENLGVLQKLNATGVTTAILSNGSPDMLQSAVASAGMTGYLNHVISVDDIRLFKTSPESYTLVEKHIHVRPSEVLFVSSNCWDALGGTWFGFNTLWINRSGLPYETIGPRPTFTGQSLTRVLEIISRSTDSALTA